MIRVTVEMWPQGDAHRKYPLGYVDIWNTGTHVDAANRGNYDSRFMSKTGRVLKRTASVVNWPRRAKPVLSLLKVILQEAGF